MPLADVVTAIKDEAWGLGLISLTLSIISFFWIGFRREKAVLKQQIWEVPRREQARIVARFLVPYVLAYVLAVGGGMALFLGWLRPPPIKILSHMFQEVEGCDGKRVPVENLSERFDIRCFDDHFRFSVKGRISDPDELMQLQKHFGTKPIRVYTVVVEERRDNGRYWVQSREYRPLNLQDGMYTSHGYVGGKKDCDRAEEGELFSIRILIPDRDAKFEHPYYWLDQLPKHLWLSDPPLYLTASGLNNRQRPPRNKREC